MYSVQCTVYSVQRPKSGISQTLGNVALITFLKAFMLRNLAFIRFLEAVRLRNVAL